MKIDLAFTPLDLERMDLTGKAVVVIDSLRATSTMVTAFEQGCAGFIPVATVEEARELAGSLKDPDVLLGGERRARALEGFQMGNSPRDYSSAKVRGKTVVMTTTNGTRALVAAREAAEVFIGAFLNLSAVGRRLTASGRDVIIACSGEKNVFCIEDCVCGGGIIAALCAPGHSPVLTDAAWAARTLYDHFSPDILRMVEASEWGQYLIGIGLGEDVRICARIDSSTLVPVYREGKVFLDQEPPPQAPCRPVGSQ
jgi:2-phosphosulfolactate phosphatase